MFVEQFLRAGDGGFGVQGWFGLLVDRVTNPECDRRDAEPGGRRGLRAAGTMASLGLRHGSRQQSGLPSTSRYGGAAMPT